MKKRRFQRCLSLLLAASMAIPTIGNFTVFAGEVPSGEDWTGCTACSEESPHMISTKADLDHIRTHLGGDGHVNGYFKLANDIAFEKADFEEGGAFYNGGLGWKPIGHDGTGGDKYAPASADIWLDGDGHSISGLEMHSYKDDVLPPNPRETMGQLVYDLAFIARPDHATIQNLTFDNAYIASRVGTGIVYSTGTQYTVVKNVTVQNSTALNMGGKVAPAAIFVKRAGGVIEDCSVINSASTVIGSDGNKYDGWYQCLFAGEVLENAQLRGLTIQDCTMDAYAYSSLFTNGLNSGVVIDGVTIQGLKAS